MSDQLPFVTLVIAARPEQAEIKAVTAGRRLDYPRENLEILIARGNQPAVQRNVAIREAHGEIIYFLDDDSMPPTPSLRKAVTHFHDSAVQMVGGPNLCPPEAPLLEHAFAQVMGSWLAFGPSRARYVAIGKVRETSEKELILCNLMARRSAMLELGGFDESLYPNEENALMDGLQAKGGKLIYDPDFLVFRHPRGTLRAFAKMLMTYGRGRAEQFRLHPTPGSALNFVPPLFCVYLPAALLARGMLLWPLALYAAAIIIQAAALTTRRLSDLPLVIPLIPMTHVLYGLGFWRGLFTRLGKSQVQTAKTVILEKAALI